MSSPAAGDARKRSWLLLVGAAIAAHALLTARLAFARFATLHNHTFDLALYTRMAWGLARGQTADPIAGGDFWSSHAAFVLWPLGWLGRWIGDTPSVLLWTQSAAIALAAWPVARFATRRLGAAGGAAAAFAFLLYPNLGHVAAYEFHPGSLALVPLCAALDAFDRERPRALLLWCVAAIACRASLSLQTAMLGVLAFQTAPRLRRSGALLALASCAYFALWLALSPHPAAGTASSAELHFGQWGGGPLGVFGTLLHDPMRVWQHFSAIERVRYPLLVLLPLGLLPLCAPRWLLVALPPLALNLLSQFPTSSGLYSHYLTPAVPALVFGAIDGLSVLGARADALGTRARAFGAIGLVLASATGSVLAGGLPWSRDFPRADFRTDAATASGRQVLALIAPNNSVQAPDPLLPHLAERASVYRAPPPDHHAEVVVLDMTHRERFAQREDLLRTLEEPLVRTWLARDDYGVLFVDRALLVLRRGLSPRGGLGRRYLIGIAPPTSGTPLSACLGVRGATLDGRRLALEFVARGACAPDLAIRLGAEDLPKRVDLLFDGVLSPAHLGRGDVARSEHPLSASERAAVQRHGLYVGALRANGAPPEPSAPTSISIPIQQLR
jgi:uncharacterized membrane protein